MIDTKKVRILILSHYYPPETGGASARISGLAKWLANFGHDVSVITGYPNYPKGRIFPEYRTTDKKVELIDGVTIFRVKVIAGSYGSIIVRLLNYLTLFLASFWIGIRKRNRFDIIIATSPPLTIGILGRLLASLYKIPWIFDIRDIWPDVGIEAGIYKEKSLISKLSRKIANYLYKHSDHIVPVTKSKSEKIVNYGVKGNKVSVVENGIDSDLIEQLIDKKWRIEYNLRDKFILTFAGLIGKAQGVDVIVETAKLLKDVVDIHFLIVGEGTNKKDLVVRAEELDLGNVTFVDVQPKEFIPSLLKTSDIGIIPLVNNNLIDAVPSKLLEAWSCKLPVILIAGGESADMVQRINGGVVLTSKDPNSIKKTILKLKDDTKMLEKYGSNGYKYVMKYLDRRLLAKKMENIIFEVLNN